MGVGVGSTGGIADAGIDRGFVPREHDSVRGWLRALADRFFPELHSIVFTSATIATGEDFGHFARTIGLDRLPDAARIRSRKLVGSIASVRLSVTKMSSAASSPCRRFIQ